MSLLDNLAEADQVSPGKDVCIIEREIKNASLTQEELEKLNGMMWPNTGTRRVPTTHLARALRKSGLPVSDKSLERHRNQDCVCYR